MGKQIFNIKGMMRDLDPAKSPNQYAYEIRNLRLTAQEDSTLLALTTEKGNTACTVTGDTISGEIIGYCSSQKYIILFTHDSVSIDHIYRLEKNSTSYVSKELYYGDLGFTSNTKIETTYIYENELVQKVYWVDGVHQPRVINIIDTDMEKFFWRDNPFDFLPLMNLKELVSIEKTDISGMFSPGTIQYALCYFNKNTVQSNIFYTSPLYYIAPNGRGEKPDSFVDTSFHIHATLLDNFDYVRVYSIHRTSENGTPQCKIVKDIKYDEIKVEVMMPVGSTPTWSTINSVTEFQGDYIMVYDFTYNQSYNINKFLYQVAANRDKTYSIPSSYYLLLVTGGQCNIFKLTGDITITYSNGKYIIPSNSIQENTNSYYSFSLSYPQIDFVDNGLYGESVDYSEILLLGGALITPTTMSHKNMTLFFDNRNKEEKVLEASEISNIRNATTNIEYVQSDKDIPTGNTGSLYLYQNQLSYNSGDITTFKYKEYYKFGIIGIDKYGRHSEVIPLHSEQNNIRCAYNGDSFTPIKAKITFTDAVKNILSKYKKIAPVILYNSDKNVICQGILCPTVFHGEERANGSLYAQSSWFFRNYTGGVRAPRGHHHTNIVTNLSSIQIPGDYEIREINGEIYGASTSGVNVCDSDALDNPMDMFVDFSILTFHSPDIEFEKVTDIKNARLRIIELEDFQSGSSREIVTTKTPPKHATSNYIRNDITENGPNKNQTHHMTQFAWKDYKFAGTSGNPNYFDTSKDVFYPIFPWHRLGGLNHETSARAEGWVGELDTKVLASLRVTTPSTQLDLEYNISNVEIFRDLPVILEADKNNLDHTGTMLYSGNIDTALVPTAGYHTYYMDNGTLNTSSGLTTNAVSMKYKSTPHGVFALKFTDDHKQVILPAIASQPRVPYGWYTAQQSSPFWSERESIAGENSNPNPSDNLLAAYIDKYEDGSSIDENVSTSEYDRTLALDPDSPVQGHITESLLKRYIANPMVGQVVIFPHWRDSRNLNLLWQISYVGADPLDSTRVIYGLSTYPGMDQNFSMNWTAETPSEYVHYTLRYPTNYEPSDILFVDTETHYTKAVSEEESISQSRISGKPGSIFLAQLESINTIMEPENSGTWLIAGPYQDPKASHIDVLYGDTYYQRYDCLKTYPYTLEDQNQIVEILSFMCETRVNIDGRYDTKRGQADNTTVTNTNFNLLNKAYTQEDNFFTYHYLDPNDYALENFPNQIIWTKTKVYGSDIDAWTHIVPTSILDMDGTLGEIKALKLWNDNLMCFQDRGIAKIMYNERTTISTQQGVPVEIANSGKVDGSQYISNQIGCSNKDSIQVTQDGIYFVDSNTKEIYRWAKGLESLSKSKGFNTYLYNNSNLDTEKTFYDPKLKDVYFEFGSECLVYNEQLAEFTSFLDYDMKFMFPFKDSLVAIKNNTLWEQFAGNYLSFFGSNKGYSVEIISAEKPTEDKIFSTVEFRADVLDNDNHLAARGDAGTGTGQSDFASYNKLPFDSIRAWNEYQDTGHYDNANSVWVDVALQSMIRKGANMSQKFRIWRADIPRVYGKPLERIRNPWARIKLSDAGGNKKTVIHDIGVTYF